MTFGNPGRRSWHRVLLGLEYFALIAAAASCVIALVAFNFYWQFGGPGRHAADSTARDDAGLTSVTQTSYSWFNWCHSELVGYKVTGYRDGQRITVLACVHPLGLFDYTRSPGLFSH